MDTSDRLTQSYSHVPSLPSFFRLHDEKLEGKLQWNTYTFVEGMCSLCSLVPSLSTPQICIAYSNTVSDKKRKAGYKATLCVCSTNTIELDPASRNAGSWGRIGPTCSSLDYTETYMYVTLSLLN